MASITNKSTTARSSLSQIKPGDRITISGSRVALNRLRNSSVSLTQGRPRGRAATANTASNYYRRAGNVPVRSRGRIR